MSSSGLHTWTQKHVYLDTCACTFILHTHTRTYAIKKKRKMHKTGIVGRPAIPALRRLRRRLIRTWMGGEEVAPAAGCCWQA